MSILFEEFSIETFSARIKQFRYKIIPYVQQENKTKYDIEKAVIDKPEIQGAIMEGTYNNSLNSFIKVYEIASIEKNEVCENGEVLCHLFDKVHLLTHADKVHGYLVNALNENARVLISKIRNGKLLNPYIYSLYQNYSNDFPRQFRIFKISSSLPKSVDRDPYLNYIFKAANKNGCCEIPIFGLSKKDISDSQSIKDIVNVVDEVYVLFGEKLSLGGYVL